MKIIFLILFSTITLINNFLYSQVNLNKTAQSTMNFLLVSNSPKSAGMGDAFTAVSKGAESMFYNPAGLSAMETEFDINFNYTQWIADINYLSGAIAWNLGLYGVVGFNLLTIDYGDIRGTSLIDNSQINEYPLGYIDNGLVSNVGAYCIGLSYAKAISNEFSIGGTIKFAGQNLGENQLSTGLKENDATKFVFDAGVKYQTGFKDFNFGMSIRNFATNLKREEYEEQLPLVFSLGASINLIKLIDENLSDVNSIILSSDFMHHNNYSERFNFGIEYKYMNMFAFRSGYQTNRDIASWSGGVGFNTTLLSYDIEINYSYSAFEYFNDVNRLSLTFAF